MQFELSFTAEASEDLDELERDNSQEAQLQAVNKCLGFLEINPRHPSLRSKKYKTYHGPNGEPLFEAYAQHRTPGAYRVFWYYGPGSGKITISSIVHHP